jgi:cell division protein FtsA
LSKNNSCPCVEIVEQQIKSIWPRRPRKKLIAGLYLLVVGRKHIKQLVEYITGMDTSGYPNEHLAGDSEEEFSSPLYATAVGLVMNSIENKTQSAVRKDEIASKVAAHQLDEYQEREARRS